MTHTPDVSPFARRGPGRPRKTESFRQLGSAQDTTRINIDLPSETNRILKLASAVYDVSRADVIRRAVSEAISQDGHYYSDTDHHKRKQAARNGNLHKPKKR